jgi:hypothetical protein
VVSVKGSANAGAIPMVAVIPITATAASVIVAPRR